MGQIRWNFVVFVSYYQILNVITEFMLLQYKQQGYEVTFISTHRFNKTMNHQKKKKSDNKKPEKEFYWLYVYFTSSKSTYSPSFCPKTLFEGLFDWLVVFWFALFLFLFLPKLKIVDNTDRINPSIENSTTKTIMTTNISKKNRIFIM